MAVQQAQSAVHKEPSKLHFFSTILPPGHHSPRSYLSNAEPALFSLFSATGLPPAVVQTAFKRPSWLGIEIPSRQPSCRPLPSVARQARRSFHRTLPGAALGPHRLFVFLANCSEGNSKEMFFFRPTKSRFDRHTSDCRRTLPSRWPAAPLAKSVSPVTFWHCDENHVLTVYS